MFKYRGVNFIKTVYRPYSPLMASLFYIGFSNQKNWKKYLGFNYKLQDCVEIEGVFYYPEYHLREFAQKATERVLKNKDAFLHLKKITLLREKEILQTVKDKVNKDVFSLFASYLEYQPALALYHICDDYIEKYIKKELAGKVSSSELDEIMSHLNLPLKLNVDQEVKRWFLKTGDIDGFIKKHSWNFSRYGQHKILSRKEAILILSDLKKEKSFGDDKNRNETKKAIIKAKKALGDKAYYVDVMQFFVYYRTHRTDVMNKVFYSYHARLSDLATKLGVSYDDIIYCSYDEILNKQIPSRKTLDSRKKEYVACFSHGTIKIIVGKGIEAFKKLCSDKNSGNIISGRTAYPGNISGPVKIISTPEDFILLKPKDILVTYMTTPAMAMIMKKASAFVTDEGGITCHASILAREMKKPCVIGTKNATKILCDGDLVEVNANKGLVRVIKRK